MEVEHPTPEEWRAFQRRLRKVRKDAGLSQEDLAKKLDRTQSYVSRHEKTLEMTFWEWVKWMDACKAAIGPFLDKVGVTRRRKKISRKKPPTEA